MAFINKFAHFLGVKGIAEPLVRKDIKESTQQLQEMYHLALKVKRDEKREEIFKDMLFFQLGHDGEKAVIFELKNSYIPMIILHDIRLEAANRSAQIDFILITHEFIMILETKKLSGDIEITAEGEFIRRLRNHHGRGYRQEGIYSPVVQNERHIDLVKQMLVGAGIIKNIPILSTVVIANPKSIINRKKASESISRQIIKIDQLNAHIKKNIGSRNEMQEETMSNIYKYLLGKHTPKQYNLMEKYSIEINELNNCPNPSIEDTAEFMKEYKKRVFGEMKDASSEVKRVLSPDTKRVAVNESPQDGRDAGVAIRGKLKSYRLARSKQEGVPPYYIFSDAELELLMNGRPKTIGELGKMKGFGPKKLEKYGQDIINIINFK